MKWLGVLSILACLSACAPPAPAPTVETVVVFLPATQESPPQCVMLEREPALPVNLPPPPKHSKPERTPPAKLIQQAEREALLQPTAQGYHGGSNRQKYLWQPGKTFAVYVTDTMATEIELPPNEILASGLALPGSVFESVTYRVGVEDVHTKQIIRLWAKEPSTMQRNVSLLTTSGRSYDLRIIAGAVGMLGVRFELAPMLHVPGEEDGGVPKERR
jgi:type IV secretory pathway VirB9-like protein